ncbi:MAG: hypothetical protein RL061_246, partial [Pseudomonadota bacterium]
FFIVRILFWYLTYNLQGLVKSLNYLKNCGVILRINAYVRQLNGVNRTQPGCGYASA